MRSLTQAAAGEWLGLRHHRKSGKIKKTCKNSMDPKVQAKNNFLITYVKKYKPYLLKEKNKLKDFYISEYLKDAA